MGNLTIRLPKSTHERLKELAHQEGASINQVVLAAVSEKLAAHRTAQLFKALEHPVTRAEFMAALAEVPDTEPDPWDVWTKPETSRPKTDGS